MRDHEIELITALAEGRLEDESEARALIESSAEYRREYEAQKLAYEALGAQGTVVMSDSERAALHRDVWTTLRSDTGEQPARTRWYYRWAPVAAGMFVVIGVVAVLNQGGDDSTAEPARLAADGVEGDAETAEAEEATTFDLTAETTQDATIPQEADDGEADAVEDTLAPEPPTAFFASEARSLRTGDPTGATEVQVYNAEQAPLELQMCVGEAGFDDFEVLATLTFTDEEAERDEDDARYMVASFIAAKPEDAELRTAPLAFIDPETCELIHLDE